jgi:ATP-dependent DNA ligase
LPRKFDGTRVLAFSENGVVSLQNRHGIIYTFRLPEIVKALQQVHKSFVLDGEVVYINPKTGCEEFTPCQRRCAAHYQTLIFESSFR